MFGKKVLALTLPLLMSLLILSGCDSEVEIFEDADAKYKPEAVSNTKLSNDVYYVKEGTKFYQVYETKTEGGAGDVDNKRCTYYLGVFERKVPTYYYGELLAYASKSNKIDDVKLERYSDTGYSMGVFGAKWEDGYITFNLNQDTVKDSDAASKFKNARSGYIMIESINGQKVTADMLNKAGVFVGFEKNKDYNVSFWAGTYYGEIQVTADTHFFQSYEIFTLEDHEITKNGYIAIRLPQDFKSGYYLIDGQGIFRYIAKEKGADLEAEDYNEQYYTSNEEQLAAFSQQYNFSIETQKLNASIVATFDTSSIGELTEEGALKMMVTSPDGIKQVFEPDLEEGKFSANYTTLTPGKWIVNISPQSLDVESVEVVDNSATQELTENSYTFNIENETTGIEFYVNYEGEGEVTAQVIGPDGQSHDLEKSRDNIGMLGYIYAWVEAGEYKINVYHYPDTKITEANYGLNEKNKEEEIITVEE